MGRHLVAADHPADPGGGVKSIWSSLVPARREGADHPESGGVERMDQDRLWREEHGSMEVSTGASRA